MIVIQLMKAHMKYLKVVSALALTLGTAQVVQAQSVSSNPFGSGSAAATSGASLTKQQAKAALSAAANKKIVPTLLDRALDAGGGEFIVVFADESASRINPKAAFADQLTAKKAAFKAARDRVRAALTSDEVEFRSELDALPMALVQFKNRGALVKMLNHSAVVGVVENSKLTLSMAESMPLIHQPVTTQSTHTGAGTTVAVLDDGTYYKDAALGSCTAPGQPASSCRVTAAEPISTVDSSPASYSLTPASHGTGVAIIAAAVAPGARIAALDVDDDTVDPATSKKRGISSFTAIKGMNWAINNKVALNVVSLNMSFGLDYKFTSACNSYTADGVYNEGAAYAAAIGQVRAAGILPVAATGNRGWTDGIGAPACVSGVVAVGATYDGEYNLAPIGGSVTYTHVEGGETKTTCSDTVTGAHRVACFSNGGNLLTMFAPGAFIRASTTATGNIKQWSGTSQAAPHVAGAIAVLRGASAFPNESLAAVESRLLNTELKVTDHRNGITKPRLDVLGSLAGAHYKVTQQIYIAYYGRPADPGGLAFWAVNLARGNAPTNIVDLNNAYDSNSSVRTVIDFFAGAPESTALYSGDTTQYVTAIYRNVLDRDPDQGGLNFWVNAINNGYVTRVKAALTIMASAMSNTDGITVDKKTAVATNFTTGIDTAAEFNGYAKPAAAPIVRSMMGEVNGSTDVNAFQSTVNSTLSQISQL